MAQADARARKNRTGIAADRMANAARLQVLEKHLGVPIKKYRDPGGGTGKSKGVQITDSAKNGDKDEVITIKID